MLRAVRFAAQLDFTIDRDTAAAMRRQATGLGTISAERIGAEMHLIMTSDRPNRAIVTLLELGLLGFVIPELIAMQSTVQDERHEHKDVFAHTMRVLAGTPNRLELRWGALLHDVGKPATKSVRRGRVHFYGHAEVGARMTRAILERLRADNRLTDRVSHIVALHMRANGYEPSWTDGAVRRFIREAGEELDNLIALSRADITSYRPRRVETGLARVAELRARCDSLMAEQDVTALDSPLDGHALMELFQRPPGPWIKPVKQHLLNLVLDGELAPEDTEGAAEIARELVEREVGRSRRIGQGVAPWRPAPTRTPPTNGSACGAGSSAKSRRWRKAISNACRRSSAMTTAVGRPRPTRRCCWRWRFSKAGAAQPPAGPTPTTRPKRVGAPEPVARGACGLGIFSAIDARSPRLSFRAAGEESQTYVLGGGK